MDKEQDIIDKYDKSSREQIENIVTEFLKNSREKIKIPEEVTKLDLDDLKEPLTKLLVEVLEVIPNDEDKSTRRDKEKNISKHRVNIKMQQQLAASQKPIPPEVANKLREPGWGGWGGKKKSKKSLRKKKRKTRRKQ